MVERAELLRVEGLTTYFPVRGRLGAFSKTRFVHAVDGVDFELEQGEVLGIVGESGCGKSTLARTIVGLERATGGRIVFDGRDVTTASQRDLRSLRRQMQLVFQNPYGSLDPRMRISESIEEPLIAYGVGTPKERRDRVSELLEIVGLDRSHARRYPHEFSGGQRQRIGIARALVLQPRLLVLDEPVSALDVSVQAQILNLLQDLRAEFGLTYIFISHDLGVIRHISTRIAVLYLGRIAEMGPSDDIYESPRHPYTKALISAVPVPSARRRLHDRLTLEGDLPSPMNPPAGCRFRTRCWKATSQCTEEVPPARVDPTTGHRFDCHHPLDEARALAGARS